MVKSDTATSASDSVAGAAAAPSRMPASGRWWKPKQSQRFSMTKIKAQKKTLSTSWKRKMEQRKLKKQMKEYERSLIEKKIQKREEQKQERLDWQKRRAENEMKSSSVQVIKDPNKLKKMSKKQLRQIKKTQVGKDGTTKYVPAYS